MNLPLVEANRPKTRRLSYEAAEMANEPERVSDDQLDIAVSATTPLKWRMNPETDPLVVSS